jgi:L-methionine (R)-S-oxide reductase
VCGAAAHTQITQVVPDVFAFPGHIACDAESRSEIVVPILVDVVVGGGTGDEAASRKLVGIIDIDSAVVETFDEVDKVYLEKLAALLANSCDW